MVKGKVSISKIVRDAGTQIRTAMSDRAIADYRAMIESGVDLDPVKLMFDGTQFYPFDGHHRIEAYERAGHTEVMAEVYDGTLEDAQVAACGENRKHGIRRSRKDVENAIKKLLELRPDWSDRQIAEHVGVHHQTVGKYRTSGGPVSTGEIIQLGNKRIGKDGKARPTSPTVKPKSGKKNGKKFTLTCPDCDGTEIAEDEEGKYCAKCKCPASAFVKVTEKEPPAESAAEPSTEPAGEAEPEVLKDAFGNIWTEGGVAAVRESDIIRQHINTLNGLKRNWNDLAKAGSRLANRMSRDSFGANIDYAKSVLKRARPYCVCPTCHGDGCKLCKGDGWITEEQYAYVEPSKKYSSQSA